MLLKMTLRSKTFLYDHKNLNKFATKSNSKKFHSILIFRFFKDFPGQEICGHQLTILKIHLLIYRFFSTLLNLHKSFFLNKKIIASNKQLEILLIKQFHKRSNEKSMLFHVLIDNRRQQKYQDYKVFCHNFVQFRWCSLIAF